MIYTGTLPPGKTVPIHPNCGGDWTFRDSGIFVERKDELCWIVLMKSTIDVHI